MTTQSSKKYDDWMQRKWRPLMGYSYMITCITDFIIFPVLWSVLQAYQGGQITSQWNPLTLQGAGLFHLAMGAVLGVAAWSRGKEKIAGMEYGNYEMPAMYAQPQYGHQYPQPYMSQTVLTGYGGRPAPMQPPHPIL